MFAVRKKVCKEETCGKAFGVGLGKIHLASLLAVPNSAPGVGDGAHFLLIWTKAGLDPVISKSTQQFSTFSILLQQKPC